MVGGVMSCDISSNTPIVCLGQDQLLFMSNTRVSQAGFLLTSLTIPITFEQ